MQKWTDGILKVEHIGLRRSQSYPHSVKPDMDSRPRYSKFVSAVITLLYYSSAAQYSYNTKYWSEREPLYKSITSNSAVAKRPRVASCRSVVSFVASTVLKCSFFIISYFSFGFTTAYNSILFCCLQRNVKPCCHTHDLS